MLRAWCNADHLPLLTVGRIFGAAALLAVLIGMSPSTPVFAVQVKPLTNWSWYVANMDYGQSGAYGYGENQAKSDNTYGGSEVVLDFGAEEFSGSTEGVSLPLTNSFASYAQIMSRQGCKKRGSRSGSP